MQSCRPQKSEAKFEDRHDVTESDLRHRGAWENRLEMAIGVRFTANDPPQDPLLPYGRGDYEGTCRIVVTHARTLYSHKALTRIFVGRSCREKGAAGKVNATGGERPLADPWVTVSREHERQPV